MSLAGTRTLKDGPGPFWGPKEKEEQELVTQHIVLQLAPYLDNMEVSIPESIEAGSLWHLRTSIRGIIRDHGLQPVINALHPTPAVCGLPVDKAREFILKSEKYDREFYTGFLGELNWGTGKHTSLYVNLRCMKLYKDQATIFVGGGITSSSEPGPEWDETVAKSTTMLKVLGY
jgi:isochorismate synthase